MKKLFFVFAALALLTPAAVGANTGNAARVKHAFAVAFNGSVEQATNCNGLAQGCVKARGGSAGRPFSGTLEADFTADWSRSTGSCAPAGGSIQLSARGGNALTLTETGKVCRTPGGYTFTGSYTVSGGSGRYATQGTGTGSATWRLSGSTVHGRLVGSFHPTVTRPEGG